MYVVFNFSIIYIFLVWNKTGSGKRKKKGMMDRNVKKRSSWVRKVKYQDSHSPSRKCCVRAKIPLESSNSVPMTFCVCVCVGGVAWGSFLPLSVPQLLKVVTFLSYLVSLLSSAVTTITSAGVYTRLPPHRILNTVLMFTAAYIIKCLCVFSSQYFY